MKMDSHEDTTFNEFEILLEEMKAKKAMRRGKWSQEEHSLFLEGFNLFGTKWSLVQKMLKTRSVQQTKSHAQKYFKSLINKTSEHPEVLAKYMNHILQFKRESKIRMKIMEKLSNFPNKTQQIPAVNILMGICCVLLGKLSNFPNKTQQIPIKILTAGISKDSDIESTEKANSRNSNYEMDFKYNEELGSICQINSNSKEDIDETCNSNESFEILSLPDLKNYFDKIFEY